LLPIADPPRKKIAKALGVQRTHAKTNHGFHDALHRLHNDFQGFRDGLMDFGMPLHRFPDAHHGFDLGPASWCLEPEDGSLVPGSSKNNKYGIKISSKSELPEHAKVKI
jgi:hypothetical protein